MPIPTGHLRIPQVAWPYLAIFFVLLVFTSLAAMAQDGQTMAGKDLRILRITPAGKEVPSGRQIVIQFDRPVVPLGRMERSAGELPITIEPQLNCQWRWLNNATLACNLNEQDRLQPATEYRISVLPGILTEENATLAEPVHHSFFTERPRVTEAWFKTWLGPQLPQNSVRFNMPVDQVSLAAHLFYLLDDGRRIPADIQEDPDYGSSAEQLDKKIWLVSPAEELPVGPAARLTVEPGIVSPAGAAPGDEQRGIDTVYAIPEFRFLGVRCSAPGKRHFIISPDSPSAAQLRCLPSAGVSLLFSAPVLAEEIKTGLQLIPPLATTDPDSDPWEQIYSYSQLNTPYRKDSDYSINLPESILRPYTEYRLQLAAGSVSDQFGRALTDSVEMRFATDHRAPDYALIKNTPVLEKDLDTDAHVWAVNLKALQLKYETLTADGRRIPGKKTITPVGPQDAAIPVPLTIRELVGAPSGLVQGNFTSQPPLPGKIPDESWFFAQVTPYQVHLKLGHHNSLVWITDLRTGQPVPGVAVEVLKSTFKNIGNSAKALASAATDQDGIALLPGTILLDPRLQHVYANGKDKANLFLRCYKDGDMAVLPVRFDYQVSAEGANREYIPDWLRPMHGHIRVWGATAQGIYRAGDTVQYKIFVRNQDNQRFTRPPGIGGQAKDAAKKSPPRYRLKVFDPMDKVVYERDDVALSTFGAFHGEVPLAKNGAVGWYRFVLTASFTNEEWEAMRVLVSDFTPAPFKVATDLSGSSFSTGDAVAISSEAKLHAGGAYSGAAARVTATLDPRPFTPDNPIISGFRFDSGLHTDGGSPGAEILYETQGNLDENGRLENTFTVVETPIWYGRLTVESSVRDDRGKSIAGRTSAPCFGRDRYVGLFQEDWTLQENKTAKVRVAVVDRDGKMIAGVPVALRTEHKETRGARVKGAGDAYLTEYEHSWEAEQEMTGVSVAEPLEFTFTPQHAGSLRLTATITDTAGRSHTTVVNRWVTGKGVVLWESTPGNLLGVYPEKSTYNVGETARFLVQNPFPGAQALITVERLGVIDHWTRTLADSSEIIEIPVLPDYLPGFYVSVMVTAPRVDKPMGPQGEDLGKPTYRIGYVKIPVKDPYKELVVEVRPEKEVYKPRDTVRVKLQVRPRNQGPEETAEPVELAVAVLDEAVFDLLLEGRKGFDPYQGFYFLDELDLGNYNLLMQLVGREKLAMKGASAGGGGGPDLDMRSLFKFVSYWNPTLAPDADGKAAIEFQVPDNLTGWKVLAMAVSPSDRMGLGEATFKVNQATEIRPALPNQVLEGDRFSAGFTLMNRTDRPRSLAVDFKAAGPVQGPAGEAETSVARRITVAPYHRETLLFPLQATASGTITMTVSPGDEHDRDGLTATLPVGKRQHEEVAASYGMIGGASAGESVLFPENMREDSGALTLELSPSVIGGVDGAFAFLRDYPYSCWEQKLSRGVMAAMYKPLRPYLKEDFRWPDSDKTVHDTLALAVEFQAPNGGMTYYRAQDQYVSPYLSTFTALAFNWFRQEGYPPPDRVEKRLQEYLLNLLRHDAVPPEYSKNMTATVRALALAVLAERGKASLADVLRYRPHLPAMNLFGKAFYLRALLAAGSPIDHQRQVLDALLAHADQSSGQLVFSESLDSGFQALLSSTIRDNAAILGSLLAWLKTNPADATVRDLAVNLARTITLSRKVRDHWPNTQENLFVVKALGDYARLFEDNAPQMTVAGRLDEQPLGSGVFTSFTNPPLVLTRPVQAGDAGRKARIQLEKSGEGRLYYGARLSYSPAQLNSSAVNGGIEVHREYSVKRDGKWLLLGDDMILRTGEVVKVDLYASLPAERYFVVLADPVPGGLEPVNRDLATASLEDAATETEGLADDSYYHSYADWLEDLSFSSRWNFYHRELRHDAVRFYSERLAAGRYHLSYTAQAIARGEFTVLPVHAEEMYAPDIHGIGVPAKLTVEAAE
jgi:hypothetical protein